MNNKTKHQFIKVNGVNLFYREAGPKDAPVILLLHGYPTSSHMFRRMMEELSDQFRLIAPDYPGYGQSDQPPRANFDYTFDNYALLIERLLEKLDIPAYSIYLMDYGAPVGWRIASAYPDRVETLIVQNGCAYEEGLETFWDTFKAYWKDRNDKKAEATLRTFHQINGLKWQYTNGVPDPALISPDNWEIDLRHLSRPENDDIQLDLFYDYQNNVKQYPKWHEYFRAHKPPMLTVFGKNDYIFPPAGAEAYKKDLPDLEAHLIDTGHFALESHNEEICAIVRDFLNRKLKKA